MSSKSSKQTNKQMKELIKQHNALICIKPVPKTAAELKKALEKINRAILGSQSVKVITQPISPQSVGFVSSSKKGPARAPSASGSKKVSTISPKTTIQITTISPSAIKTIATKSKQPMTKTPTIKVIKELKPKKQTTTASIGIRKSKISPVATSNIKSAKATDVGASLDPSIVSNELSKVVNDWDDFPAGSRRVITLNEIEVRNEIDSIPGRVIRWKNRQLRKKDFVELMEILRNELQELK